MNRKKSQKNKLETKKKIVESDVKVDMIYKNKQERDMIDKIKYDCGMD